MSKRPSFQFYPADWRNEAGLRLCSLAARGLWAEMMCLMHDCEPYGHLTYLGRAMTHQELARLVGESPALVRRLLAELKANDVCSETEEGIIHSRRMVRDEALREVRANGGVAGAAHGNKGALHGAKGGRPRKEKGGSDDRQRGDEKPPLKPPPSSSSSSPPSEDSSEANASAQASLFVDPDKTAWQTAKLLLEERASMSTAAAGRFFGKLLSDHGLEARDLLASIVTATTNGTGDPKAFLAGAAANLSKRRKPGGMSASDLAARSNIQ